MSFFYVIILIGDIMFGAIIGDLAGSIYEYSQIKGIQKIEVKDLICDKSFFSDDTILTIAILDSILNNIGYEESLKKYTKNYIDYKPNYKPYFKSTFSPGFIKWSEGKRKGDSIGNGAMMRISSVGYLFNNEDDVIINSRLATIPSHNTIEAIDSATIIALIIFYIRKGLSKEEIINKLNLKINYKEFTKFNMTCYETIDNCLYALFNSNSFEDSIKKIISYGGDTDTNACIVGSMAEAMYGIDLSLIIKAREKLPNDFNNLLDKGYEKIKKI